MSRDRAKKLYRWARTLPKERAAALSLGISAAVLIIWTMTQGAKYPHLIPVYELGLVAGLVGMTAMYVYFTSKMVEEMKEQRYTENLPLLVPIIPPILHTDKLPYESIQSGSGIKVIWCNVGKGTAINSRFCFYPAPTSSGKAESFPPHELGTLEVGVDGEKEVDFDKIFERYNRETKLLDDKRWHQISNTYQPRLEAEYQDIYERKITTVQEFRIDEQNNTKRVCLGDLYFTVNGKRLGEEATQQ